jgi:hypothetical protein
LEEFEENQASSLEENQILNLEENNSDDEMDMEQEDIENQQGIEEQLEEDLNEDSN